MRSSHSLDAIAVTFDDPHAVADAGLILPATLAQHLGLRELFDDHVDLGDAPGHANVGTKQSRSSDDYGPAFVRHRRRPITGRDDVGEGPITIHRHGGGAHYGQEFWFFGLT